VSFNSPLFAYPHIDTEDGPIDISKHSAFKIVDYDGSRASSLKLAQDLRDFHVVIRAPDNAPEKRTPLKDAAYVLGQPRREPEVKGMSSFCVLGCSHPTCMLLDLTWSDSEQIHFNKAAIRVKISDIVKEAQKDESDRRVWNALDFAGVRESMEHRLARLDLAFLAYQGGKGLLSDQPPDDRRPDEHLEWGMMNTQNTYSECHFDANGCLTWMKIMNKEGSKWWGVPATKNSTMEQIDEIAAMASQFDISEVEWEFICLQPGDIL